MKCGHDTKQRLLDTAIRLIWEQSYRAVSVEVICKQADAKKGSFYHFFPSKSDLAVAAMEQHWNNMLPAMERDFAPEIPPLERLGNYCDSVYRHQKQRRQEFGRVCGCAFTSLGLELSTQDQHIRKKTRQIMDRICRYLERTVRDAVADGLIEATDCQLTARALHSCVLGVLVRAKIENDLEVIRQLKPALFQQIGARPVGAK